MAWKFVKKRRVVEKLREERDEERRWGNYRSHRQWVKVRLPDVGKGGRLGGNEE